MLGTLQNIIFTLMFLLHVFVPLFDGKVHPTGRRNAHEISRPLVGRTFPPRCRLISWAFLLPVGCPGSRVKLVYRSFFFLLFHSAKPHAHFGAEMCLYQPITFTTFSPSQACQGIYMRKGLPWHNSVPSGGRRQQKPQGNQGI